jgi:uncharacterized lipoprotein YajG
LNDGWVTENMIRYVGRVCAAAVIAVAVTGCAATAAVSGGDGTIKISDAPVPEMNAPRNAVTVSVLPYVDARKMSDPRKIGVGGHNVYGMGAPTGNDILLSRDVATVVTDVMARRMEDAGYRVVNDNSAAFEISGTVRQLSYDIKDRDRVSIVIETTLKDAATGKVLWSAAVTEKKDRFAGMGGDNIADVAAFLRAELGVVTQKTANAITGVLAAAHPDMFHVVAGTKPVSGVTVLNAPAVPAAPAVPVVPVATQASANGVLKITTEPSRAEIYIGGVYYGLTPLRLELAPGILEVKAQLRHHRTVTEKVSVRKGETTELDLRLRK